MYKASVIKSYCFIGFLLYLAVITVGKQCEIFKFIGESGLFGFKHRVCENCKCNAV